MYIRSSTHVSIINEEGNIWFVLIYTLKTSIFIQWIFRCLVRNGFLDIYFTSLIDYNAMPPQIQFGTPFSMDTRCKELRLYLTKYYLPPKINNFIVKKVCSKLNSHLQAETLQVCKNIRNTSSSDVFFFITNEVWMANDLPLFHYGFS